MSIQQKFVSIEFRVPVAIIWTNFSGPWCGENGELIVSTRRLFRPQKENFGGGERRSSLFGAKLAANWGGGRIYGSRFLIGRHRILTTRIRRFQLNRGASFLVHSFDQGIFWISPIYCL